MSVLSSIALPAAPSAAKDLTLRVLSELWPEGHACAVGVRLWDGTLYPDDTPRPTTIVLKHPGALRTMLLAGNEVGLGEAYLNDDYDIEGPVENVFDLAQSLGAESLAWMHKARALVGLLRLPQSEPHQHGPARQPARLRGRRHSPERDRQAVAYHYNASNDFYALWLDARMVYSCAYFETAHDDINLAQARKLDYICRKLRLQPGQQLLDLGCGWGGLIMHAARHYGVDATGITLSEPQARLATDRIAAAGLQGRCRVELRDYRELDAAGQYDVLSSIGMFEHVGEAMLPAYFEQAYALLRPRGVFLNHGIAYSMSNQLGPGPSFIENYVFPDGELVPISTTLRAGEASGFEVRDVESLREHYTRTLRCWIARLEDRHDDAMQYVDEASYRTWRLYLAGSAHGFDVGRLNLYQTLLVKPDAAGASGLPLTRAAWYQGGQGG